MKNFITNWRTTSTGLLMIIGAAYVLFTVRPLTQEVFMASVGGILGGLGFIFSKDGVVTGGTVGQTAESKERVEIDK